MLNYTQDDIKVDGVKIHYYRTGGKKPPFILLHGATDSGLCWTPVAELLAKDYDVIIIPNQVGNFSSFVYGVDSRFGPMPSKDKTQNNFQGSLGGFLEGLQGEIPKRYA